MYDKQASLSFITDVGHTNIISVPICLKWYMMSQPIFNCSFNDVAWKRCYAVGSGTKSAKHHFTSGLETLMNETVGTVWLVWLRQQKHLLCLTDGCATSINNKNLHQATLCKREAWQLPFSFRPPTVLFCCGSYLTFPFNKDYCLLRRDAIFWKIHTDVSEERTVSIFRVVT